MHRTPRRRETRRDRGAQGAWIRDPKGKNETPIAELVPEALDRDSHVRGHPAGPRLLILDVGDEILRREAVEPMLDFEPGSVLFEEFAGEATEGGRLDRASRSITAPEGSLPGSPARAPRSRDPA